MPGVQSAILPSMRSVLFVARGGSWSPETHHHWPERFKATARALLITAHATASRQRAVEGDGSEPAGCCLGDLPPGVLLHILRLAATPLARWL